eukprot:TRINITY_DN29130_c0_g1_i1.p1 TRINITY_DN29130_c0_g1~~TRINITY_DN29130_c0_g1_i1.p1  ORF type:complete len:689 (-),score=110.21 TRINITY_DN29130_c0_g1_i1:13-2055(-)
MQRLRASVEKLMSEKKASETSGALPTDYSDPVPLDTGPDGFAGEICKMVSQGKMHRNEIGEFVGEITVTLEGTSSHIFLLRDYPLLLAFPPDSLDAVASGCLILQGASVAPVDGPPPGVLCCTQRPYVRCQGIHGPQGPAVIIGFSGAPQRDQWFKLLCQTNAVIQEQRQRQRSRSRSIGHGDDTRVTQLEEEKADIQQKLAASQSAIQALTEQLRNEQKRAEIALAQKADLQRFLEGLRQKEERSAASPVARAAQEIMQHNIRSLMAEQDRLRAERDADVHVRDAEISDLRTRVCSLLQESMETRNRLLLTEETCARRDIMLSEADGCIASCLQRSILRWPRPERASSQEISPSAYLRVPEFCLLPPSPGPRSPAEYADNLEAILALLHEETECRWAICAASNNAFFAQCLHLLRAPHKVRFEDEHATKVRLLEEAGERSKLALEVSQQEAAALRKQLLASEERLRSLEETGAETPLNYYASRPAPITRTIPKVENTQSERSAASRQWEARAVVLTGVLYPALERAAWLQKRLWISEAERAFEERRRTAALYQRREVSITTDLWVQPPAPSLPHTGLSSPNSTKGNLSADDLEALRTVNPNIPPQSPAQLSPQSSRRARKKAERISQMLEQGIELERARQEQLQALARCCLQLRAVDSAIQQAAVAHASPRALSPAPPL